MVRSLGRVSVRLLMTCSALGVCMQVPAQEGGDPDTREVQAYVLTEAGLAKYTQALRNLSRLPQGTLGGCDQDSDADSLADAVALLNSMPGAEAAIRAAGMTTHEYAVFSWSLIHTALAAWASSEPGGQLPPGASRANVDFYKKHEAALQALNVSQSNDVCEEEEQFDEEEPER